MNLHSNNNRECCNTDMTVILWLTVGDTVRIWPLFVHIIQVKVLLRWRLKLIVMMSLSIHIQDRMCVQCVTNSLEGNIIWTATNKRMLENCMHAISVTNVMLMKRAWGSICTFTAVSTSVLSVESVSVNSTQAKSFWREAVWMHCL